MIIFEKLPWFASVTLEAELQKKLSSKYKVRQNIAIQRALQEAKITSPDYYGKNRD